ncbi:hypothetical protein WJX74_008397 [Apatococcus lobatus]|uniref:Uncharacterized protein n=1 Tax=Apatococcus lobatus TaxID=904363 RepID=A0AAW1RZC8_9CHLO
MFFWTAFTGDPTIRALADEAVAASLLWTDQQLMDFYEVLASSTQTDDLGCLPVLAAFLGSIGTGRSAFLDRLGARPYYLRGAEELVRNHLAHRLVPEAFPLLPDQCMAAVERFARTTKGKTHGDLAVKRIRAAVGKAINCKHSALLI